MRAARSQLVRAGRIIAECLWAPLAPADEQAAIEQRLAAFAGTSHAALTLEEELGPKIAREVAELEVEQDEWLQKQRVTKNR
ncbi:MAG TPA: hypothetical protein VMW48_10690 [Vicinamibacterales bacterium]|nr:hypothetical protein [Vicinamibacterales bacterium]